MLHFDGSTWSVIATPPQPGGWLAGLAALSPTDAWAVGRNVSGTLTEHWDGTQWSVVPSRTPLASTSAVLSGIAATSATDIWAVGSFFNTSSNHYWALTEHWDGSHWHIVPSRHPSENTWLNGVTAVATKDVWAVGSRTGVFGAHTLLEHWDGTIWSWSPSPERDVSSAASLAAVSAVSPTNVWAVGRILYTYGSGPESLVEHWNGADWAVIPGTNISGYGVQQQLSSVVALSPSSVWAAGEEEGEFSLLEHWDGTRWILSYFGGGNTSLYAAADVGGMVWGAGYDSDNQVAFILPSCAV